MARASDPKMHRMPAKQPDMMTGHPMMPKMPPALHAQKMQARRDAGMGKQRIRKQV